MPGQVPAEVGKYDLAFAFVSGADIDVAGKTGPPHHFAFGHAERDAARGHRPAALLVARDGIGVGRDRGRWRHGRVGEIAGHGADRPVGRRGRRSGRCRRSRRRLRDGRRAAAAIRSDQIFRGHRSAGIELDIAVVVAGGPRPTGLCEHVHGLGEPAALVVVLEQLHRVLAAGKSRGEPNGTHNERNPGNDATTQNSLPRGDLSACPLICILRHHDGGDKPRRAEGLTEPLADRALADQPLA